MASIETDGSRTPAAVTTAPFGIVVFQAEDEDEAAEVMAKDPTFAARVQEAELHPFKTGLVRGEPAGEG